MKLALLRIDAPLVSFGGPSIDNFNRTDLVPGRSLVTGLLANALGYDHRDTEALQRLQHRIRLAARRERQGVLLSDYQTVDLGQRHMLDANAWTTWGKVDGRGGATATATGTHIRHREYLADAIYSLAVGLEPADETPTLEDAAQALRRPARPLFVGRKCCIPSVPLLVGIIEATGPLAALVGLPAPEVAAPGRLDAGPVETWWELDDPSEQALSATSSSDMEVSDLRDWANQVHVGRRFLRHGLVARQEG